MLIRIRSFGAVCAHVLYGKTLFLLAAFLFFFTSGLHAQQAAAAQPTHSQALATVEGIVTDASGALLPGATVVLEDLDTHKKLTDETDGAGEFSFLDIPAARYSITITAEHFIKFVKDEVTLDAGEYFKLPDTALQQENGQATVIVHAGENYEIAEQQLDIELHQRVLGVIPNFYVVYDKNPAPMSAGQKYRLALRATFDWTTIWSRGFIAGIEQADDTFPGYHQGWAAYGERYGSVLANDFFGNLLAYAVFPSILHQDPRYIYQGEGSIASRTGHALISPFSCRGDNGKTQVNYSNILGTFAASGISNLYYPASDRHGYQLTVENAGISFAADAMSSFFQEFVLKKLSNLRHKNKDQ